MFRSLVIAAATTFILLACVGDEHVDTSKPSSSSSSSGAAAGTTAMVPNSDFEGANCDHWEPTNTTVADVTYGVGGTHACLVCSKGEEPVYGLQQHLLLVGLNRQATYTAVIHARKPASGIASDALLTTLFLDTGPGSMRLTDTDEIHVPPLTETYAEVKTGTVSPKEHPEAQYLVIEVINRKSDSGCFVVDDITLTEQ